MGGGAVVYWLLKSVFLGPVLRLIFRPWTEGAQHVPAHGPAILASNHLSFSDSIFLPMALPRRITFPAKAEYFTGTGLKGRLTRAFFRGTGQIPIDRSGGSASASAIDAGVEVLRRGELFGIYPEGTRSPDGRLYKGKTGVARMALQARCPVIPVAMIDTDKAQPTGQVIPNIHRVGVRFGAPLDFSRFYGMDSDRVVLRAVTDELMSELARLSGQEYVDEYAAGRKAAALAARAEALMVDARGRADVLIADARVEGAAAAQRVRAEGAAAAARARAESVAAATKAREKAEDLVAGARRTALRGRDGEARDLDESSTTERESSQDSEAMTTSDGLEPAEAMEPPRTEDS